MLEDMKPADTEQLLALEAELRDLALKESDIVAQLDEVLAEKQRVRRLIAATKNQYAPIYSLPDELLISIVEAAQNLQWTDPASSLIEVTASHISQRFRSAIIAASSLWTSIELRWGLRSDEDRVAAYLLRSRARLLSVRLKCDTYHGHEDLRNKLEVVAAHISRIRRLVLQCGEAGSALQDAVAPLRDLHAPYLEHLEVYSHPDMAGCVSIFKQGAPRLRTLKLRNVVFSSVPPTNPWFRLLTNIELGGMQTGIGMYIWPGVFAASPNLVDVTVDGSTFTASDLTEYISMPTLRSLTALRLHSSALHVLVSKCVLAHIRAPALEVLQFSGVHGDQISSFFNNVPHSRFPALRSLTFAAAPSVQRWRCTDCALLERASFDSFSALTSLTIINVCHMHKLVEDLLRTSQNADGSTVHNLPALQILTLRYEDVDNFGRASSGWPSLGSLPYDRPHTDPLDVLCQGLIARRETHPIQLLRLPHSRFFTEQCWSSDVAPLEIFDVEPLLQSLGLALGYVSEDYKMKGTEPLW
ncbi:hypothetical protein B0H16DRAFT_1896645 [Mycena metata]|uniref:F-box domain-containing protein n=1 Tax=Mycena metata TaxID=1033252 RepID=A0AAD7HHQ3_9AGAR|nr:hypothetical protein B0H16DRAFT_1896645 [Mycena metata]